jgi:hypothetical protein
MSKKSGGKGHLQKMWDDPSFGRNLTPSSIPDVRGGFAEPLVWKGHVYELAECIANMFDAGLLKANSRNDAFEQACKHFAKPDGSQFSAKSLYQSLEQKRGFPPSR